MTYSLKVLFKKVRRILYRLTPQNFHQLMKQVMVLTIDREERLKGVVDMVFEKAINESSLSMPYGEICCCLATVSSLLSWAEKCLVFGTRESCVCNVIVWIGSGEVHKYSFFVNSRINQLQKNNGGINWSFNHLLEGCAHSVSLRSQQFVKCLCSKWINWFIFSFALMQNNAVKSNTIQYSMMMRFHCFDASRVYTRRHTLFIKEFENQSQIIL